VVSGKRRLSEPHGCADDCERDGCGSPSPNQVPTDAHPPPHGSIALRGPPGQPTDAALADGSLPLTESADERHAGEPDDDEHQKHACR